VLASTAASWTEVGIFWATVGGVTVTLLAVLVALLGPRLQARWSRPVITVAPSTGTVYARERWPIILRLRVANKSGRETARDVEVFASVQGREPGDGATLIVARTESLNFEDPSADGPRRSIVNVPSGFSREVGLATLSPSIDRHGQPHIGRITYYRPDIESKAILRAGVLYEVHITVTGSNFDAVRYQGHLVSCALSSLLKCGILWHGENWTSKAGVGVD
jgi:hypothetical protein